MHVGNNLTLLIFPPEIFLTPKLSILYTLLHFCTLVLSIWYLIVWLTIEGLYKKKFLLKNFPFQVYFWVEFLTFWTQTNPLKLCTIVLFFYFQCRLTLKSRKSPLFLQVNLVRSHNPISFPPHGQFDSCQLDFSQSIFILSHHKKKINFNIYILKTKIKT